MNGEDEDGPGQEWQQRILHDLQARAESAADGEAFLAGASAALEAVEAGMRVDASALSALMGHELSTPLAIAAGYVGLAVDEAHSDELRGALTAASRNIQLTQNLLRSFRSLRGVEERTLQLRSEDVDLVELVRNAVDDLRQAVLGDRDVTVQARDEVVVTADPDAIHQIMFNLLNNAEKYSPAGRPIDVDVTTDGEWGVIVVRNHGMGIAPEDRERIFNRFAQVDPTHGQRGVGIGLYISRGLARAMGGDLTAEPAEEEGSRFVLTLPRKEP